MTKRIRTPLSVEASRLLHLLKFGKPHREVYLAVGHPRQWFVSYAGGEVSESAVMELRDNGLIRSCYSDCPDQGFHVGKTLDCEKTSKAIRRLGKNAKPVFVDE